MKARLGATVLAAALLLIPIEAAAKYELTMITVAGPDWYGEIKISDPETLAQLDINAFLEFDDPVAPPGGLGEGYLVNHGYLDGEQQFVAFTRMMFVPGSPSYVYFIELVNGASSMDGKWYRVTHAGKVALLDALRAGGAHLTIDPISGEIPQPTGVAQYVGVGLAALVGAAAGWLMGRENRKLVAPVMTNQ
jgi:hypothetical protein